MLMISNARSAVLFNGWSADPPEQVEIVKLAMFALNLYRDFVSSLDASLWPRPLL